MIKIMSLVFGITYILKTVREFNKAWKEYEQDSAAWRNRLNIKDDDETVIDYRRA